MQISQKLNACRLEFPCAFSAHKSPVYPETTIGAPVDRESAGALRLIRTSGSEDRGDPLEDRADQLGRTLDVLGAQAAHQLDM